MNTSKTNTVQITQHTYPDEWPALAEIRRQVFMLEQGVSAADEWDEADKSAQHFLLKMNCAPIACARLFINNQKEYQIGRMAVLKSHRGKGYGQGLLQAIILEYSRLQEQSQDQPSSLVLHAQLQAQRFYQRLGFTAVGGVFIDADIAHIKMEYRKKDLHGERAIPSL